MSADRFGICPKCVIDYDKTLIEKRKRLESEYGNIPVDEYIELVAEIEYDEDVNMEKTFREDYGFDLDEGILTIEYYGVCSLCGFKYSFQKKIDILKGK